MHKKIDTSDLNVPTDDIDCWTRYPKHRWVYDVSRLLDSQNIEWSPFPTVDLNEATQNIVLGTADDILCSTGIIYTKKHQSQRIQTEIYIIKGEIKLMQHIDAKNKKPVDTPQGTLELRLNAFVTMHFSKFTGIITVTTCDLDIHRVQLRPYSDLGQNTNLEILKLTKRIYKRTDTTLNGPADQSLHETLAS